MNKRSVLFIRPKDCRYCSNGFFGLGHTVDYAATKSFNIKDLQQLQADNPYIDDGINSFQPYLIYGNGHGNNTVFTANSETPVWVVGEDLTHLSGRIVYLLSCLTANQLGPYIIQQGALAYGGFLISWTWMSGDIAGDPYTDTYAEGFYRGTNKFFESLLDGNTIGQAKLDSIAEYNYWIDWWTNSDEDSASEVVKWLIWDRDGLVTYGDQDASTVQCEEILARQECIESGCWWYDGSCHCDIPNAPMTTYDFTVKAIPSKAHISKFDAWYNLGYKVDNELSWVDYNIYIKNVGIGVSSIFAKLFNVSNGELLWHTTLTLNPNMEEKQIYKRETRSPTETHKLQVFHEENGIEVLDETMEHTFTTTNCKRFGGTTKNEYLKISQDMCRFNLIGVKYSPPVNCDAIAIETYADMTHYMPDPVIRYAIYKVSDGSLVKTGSKGYFRSGGYGRTRIHFDTPVRLNAGEEYWFTVQKGDEDAGYALCYRAVLKPGISATMPCRGTDPIPNTFIPTIGDKEYFIWVLYDEVI